jgi:hypothetical protein
MRAQPRLQSFLFSVKRDDGGSRFAICHARDAATARRYARTWAARFGFTVELVLEHLEGA